MRFSPNGKLLACIADKRQIKILDATTGDFMRVLSAAEKDTSRPESADELWLFSLTFSRDGRRIAAIAEHDVAIWDVGQEVAMRMLHKPDAYFLACNLGPDDRIPIISWTGERKSHDLFPVRLLDGKTGKDWRGLSPVAGNVLSNLRDLNIVISPDAGALVVNFRSRARAWRESTQIAQVALETGSVEAHIDPQVEQASSPVEIAKSPNSKPSAFSPTRRRVINEQGICDAATGYVFLPLAELLGDSGMVDDKSPFSFDWSPDGKRIAIKVGKTVRVVAISDDAKS